jgi:hypothetical protein
LGTSELFGLAIRVLGLWQFVSGVVDLARFASPWQPYNNDLQFFHNVLVLAVSTPGIQLVIGCLLFFGADRLVRLAYPQSICREDTNRA